MRKSLLLLFIFGAGAILQACAPKPQDDCGFNQNVYGERISWKGRLPVVFELHESVPQENVAAIQSAMDTWNKAAGKTVLQLDTSRRVSGTASARDRANVISFSAAWDPAKLSEQAKTAVHWVGDQIQEADVRVNASKAASGEQYFSFYFGENAHDAGVNLEALILHELGHALGLKHKDTGGSVMNTYLANNSDRVALAATDDKSLQCEY